MLEILCPKIYAASVLDVDPARLKRLGIRGVLLDLDNTIVRRDSDCLTPEVAEWLRDLKHHGLKVCIVSNNSRRRVSSLASQLGMPAVYRAVKPFRAPFSRALKLLGTAPNETALIGDQIFTDILGGNLAGLFTILVAPLKGKEFWGTRFISRPLEKLVLARLRK